MKKWSPIHYSLFMFCFLWAVLIFAAFYPFEEIPSNTVSISIVYAGLKAAFGAMIYGGGLSLIKSSTGRERRCDIFIKKPF